jgi:predicted enzyme related to lactoylglutathione lyase
MKADVLFSGLPVADLSTALEWYERLLGRAADLIPNDSEAAWQLSTGGWIYVVRDPERAGHSIVTLIIEDLDGVCERIRERGVSHGEIQSVGTAGRKAFVTDPEGNTIALTELASD